MALAKRYSILAFYNTGFNATNIPYTADVITSSGFRFESFPDCTLLQNKGLATLKVNTTWDTIDGADYICVQDTEKAVNTWYFVLDITMLNLNVARLSLAMDALTTIGLNNLEWATGWASRKHVRNDELFANTMDEPFQPSNPLIISGTQNISLELDNSSQLVVYASTVSLERVSSQGQAVTFGDGLNTVTIPKVPESIEGSYNAGDSEAYKSASKITLGTLTGDFYQANELPNTALYISFKGDSTSSKLSILRSIGIEESISAAYKLPFLGYDWPNPITGQTERLWEPTYANPDDTTNAAHLLNVVVRPKLILPSNVMKWEFGQFNNKKVFAGVFNTYTLCSIVSGNSAEFRPEDIAGDIERFDRPLFAAWIDPTPDGKPYARPFWFKGDSNNQFLNVVSGEAWTRSQILYTKQSGAYDNEQAMRYAEAAYKNQIVDLVAAVPSEPEKRIATAKSWLKSQLSLANLFSSSEEETDRVAATRAYAEYTRSQRQIEDITNQFRQQQESMARQIYIQKPSISFPRSSSLQNYIGNNFVLYRTRLTDADAKRYDKFLTMYGYHVDEALTKADFTARQYFSYIQCSEIQLKVNQSRYIINMAEQQLMQGVRIWRVAPNPSYYTSGNPIAPAEEVRV